MKLLLQCKKIHTHTHTHTHTRLVAQSCSTLFDPMDCSLPGSSVLESRQEYWSGLPCPPPGDLPDPGREPMSLALRKILYCCITGDKITCSVIYTTKAMASHSSTLAWKIPWTEEPGKLQSMGSQRVGHDWATSLSLFTFMHWRRKWQPTPVFLPGESQEWGSLVGCQTSMTHRVGHDWSDLAAAAHVISI